MKVIQHASLLIFLSDCHGLSLETRRSVIGWMGSASAGLVAANANAAETTDVDNFLRSGMVSMPMGVSGQAGKAKPQTGVVIPEGTDVSRDSKSGNVFAEILVQKTDSSDLMPVVTSFQSPWALATGSLFDIECRDSSTGDGAFVAVSPNVGGSSVDALKDSFFIKFLFSPTGRFSFYGQPTDIKVKSSEMRGDYRILDVSFATLSQSTQTEIPRKARVIATIPSGSKQAVMLVSSVSALRWKKGGEQLVTSTIESFKATPAPLTSMKIRAQDRSK
ncbi:MAG: hypothetical protein SGBAC_009410 [Bacillariaceae sp.]